MTSINQEDEFTEVARKCKKCRAISSPMLPALQKTGSSEPPPVTPAHLESSYKNKIPVIISGVDKKFQNWRQIMGELRQYHPSLKVSSINKLPKGDFIIISDSVQDMIILQNESTMKAALGQKVQVSLPKAFQTSKVQNKHLAIKGVPTDITETEFREFLDLSKINYAKAERLKSKKDGRVLPIFQLDINDPDEAEALISQSSACIVAGIVYKVEEFRAPKLVIQCYNCQCFSHLAKTCRSKQKCLICRENHSHKGCLRRESRKPTCANCKGPHVASYKSCPEYKRQVFRQHVVNNQKSYASVISQNTLSQPKPNQTFTFTAEQLTKFVANVIIQIAQPQVCYPNYNPKQDTLDLKSSMCCKVSQAAKNILKFYITGKDLFESIGPLSAPCPPKSFTFTSTKVNSTTKPTSKPPTTLKSTSPPSNSTKAVPKQPKTS